MGKKIVTAAIPVLVSVEVEVDDSLDEHEARDVAIDLAYPKFRLKSFIGNGGVDRMIGVVGKGVSITPGEVLIECDGFEITVEDA